MAFDAEGARKAGYTDAEIAGFMAKAAGFDLAGAKSAGYSDGEVIAHLAAKPAQAVIPGQEGEAARVAAERAKPAPTLAQRAVGTGEAALATTTGVTGGSIGMLGGFFRGLADEILSGKFGTADANGIVEKSMAEGAAALTYRPRTAEGQEQTAAVGEVMQNLIPIAGVAPSMMPPGRVMPPAGTPARVVAQAGVESSARAVAGEPGAAAVTRASATAARVADLAGKQITTLPRRALEALRRDPAGETPTAGTMGSAGSAGADVAAQRRATAAQLGFTGEASLTRGQATRDAAQLKFEVETSKLPDAGKPLRDRVVAQNQRILQNFDAWVDETGAQAPTLRATGVAVDQALVKQSAADKARIRAAYKQAEAAGELEQPVTLAGLVDHLNDSAPDAATAPLLEVARRRAVQLGVATQQADGTLSPAPVKLKAAETFRQAIGRATDTEATNIRQATIIKALVDEGTAGAGGTLYKQARGLRSRYAQNYENRATIAKLLDTKRGTADRAVAFEDVFSHAILKGSLDDVRNVRRVLQRAGGDGAQAWRELQGQTVQWLRDEATKSVATDSAGRRVISPAGLDRAVRSLDVDGRLEFVFGKQGAQRMRDLNELAQVIKTVPPEAAVNTSNTVSTLLTAFGDVGMSGMAGAPVPLMTMTKVVRQYVRDRALRRRIEDALADVTRKAPGKNNQPRRAPSSSETFH